MPSTRSKNPELLDGPDWITKRTRGRGKNAILRTGHGASPRATQSGDESTSSRPKSVYSQYYPDVNLKSDLLKLSSSRRTNVNQGTSGYPLELQSSNRGRKRSQGLLEGGNVHKSRKYSMELSSQRSGQQRKSNLSYQQLGY